MKILFYFLAIALLLLLCCQLIFVEIHPLFTLFLFLSVLRIVMMIIMIISSPIVILCSLLHCYYHHYIYCVDCFYYCQYNHLINFIGKS